MSEAGIVSVSEGEYRLVEQMARKGVKGGSLEEVSDIIGMDKSSLASLVFLLRDRGLASVKEVKEQRYELTDKGRRALTEGLPEEMLAKLAISEGPRLPISLVKEKLGVDAGIAIGIVVRRGMARVSGGVLEFKAGPERLLEEASKLRSLLESISRGSTAVNEELLREALERGLVRRVEERRHYFTLVDEPSRLLKRMVVEVSRLDSGLIKSGEWRRVRLRKYDVRAEPPVVRPARRHYLAEFIEILRDIMVSLGFKEVSGPLVEIELFNFDVLFQAQDHPAREIHDTLRIDYDGLADVSGYMDVVRRVERIHRDKWGYEWKLEVARRLILRSQTTSVSSRVLITRPKPPLRVFTIGRVFRSDVVDATHLPEFHQLDGLEGYYGYTFRDLLSRLDEIASMLGLKLKFKPSYFPFTEPSVEGYVKLPNGKWLELFGAGMLRPEVLEMAGIDYPVGAWGFGVERLAAAFYGFSDIRMLYTKDIDLIRSMKAVFHGV